ERLWEGAGERPRRARPGARDAVEAARRGAQVLLAARLDVGQLELLAEDLREVFERDLDLEHVLARVLARLALTALARHRLALLAVSLADAPLLVLAEAEPRQHDLRHRDADVLLPLLADQLARRDEALQVLFDLAADDLAEPRVILVDAPHALPLIRPWCRRARRSTRRSSARRWR